MEKVMNLHTVLAREIGLATGQPAEVVGTESVGGGCISQAARVKTRDGRRFFVKLSDATRLPMFIAEVDGLYELARAQVLRVPAPVCVGATGEQAYLVLEHLNLGGDMAQAAERLAIGLAAMHRITQTRFGWRRDNTIGATPQPNDYCDDWIEFWRERRLRHQFALAAQHGASSLMQQGEALLDRLPALFDGYRPSASLLHGDLWAGNVAATPDGEPVIFDPAVYYGDREADLAMTELFGGFSPRFQRAYRDAWPLDPGYATRKTLYNLYHVVNHFNLFGGGYLAQAERMIQQLLGELR